MHSVGLSARTKECGQCREVKIRVNTGLSARTKECGQCREVKIRVNIWTVSDCLPGPKSVANVERLK